MCRKVWSPLMSLCLLLAALVVTLPAVAEEPSSEPAAVTQSTEQQPTAVAARCARCGDGYCARSCENERTCPADCAPQTKTAAAGRCGKCGDGTCVKQCGETPESCPADCGYSSPSSATESQPVECAGAKAKPEAKKE